MNQDLSVVVATLSVYAAVVVSPGPNFALISRLAIAGARPAAIGATLGLALAATFYAILTMTGLALVLQRVGWLATAVQIAGGAYLVYLGIAAWRSGNTAHAVTASDQQIDVWRGLRMGLVVNLSNPKGIAFFLGLYAVMIPPGTSSWAQMLVLAGGFSIEVIWYGLVTLLMSSAPARAMYRRIGQWIERVIGVVLVGIGCRLIAEKI